MNGKESKAKELALFGTSMIGSHIAGNYIINKALQTKKGKKFIEDIAFARKKLSPAKLGLVSTFLGPEYAEMHIRSLKNKNPELYRKLTSRKSGFIRAGSSILSTLASAPVPGLNHFTEYNLMKDNILSMIPKSFDKYKNYVVAKSFIQGAKNRGSLSNKLAPILKSPFIGKIRSEGESLGKYVPKSALNAADSLLDRMYGLNNKRFKSRLVKGVVKLLA